MRMLVLVLVGGGVACVDEAALPIGNPVGRVIGPLCMAPAVIDAPGYSAVGVTSMPFSVANGWASKSRSQR